MRPLFATRFFSFVTLVSFMFWAFSPLAAVADETEQAPDIQIVAPEPGCTVRAGENLAVLIVTMVEDISSVAILCDDRGITLLQEPPYTANLDTTNLPAGSHLLRAFAYLKNGERKGAEPVAISILPARAEETEARNELTTVTLTQVTLKERTPVLLRTTKEMVSGKVPVGSTVTFVVARDVFGPNNEMLIEYGAPAYGKVTRSRKRGMLGRRGKLEFTVESVMAADGTAVPLRASEKASGKSNKGVVIASALVLTVFAIFVHGKDVTVPEGTEVAAYVDRDTLINPTSLHPQTTEPRGAPVEIVEVSFPQGSRVRAGEPLHIKVQPEPAEKAVHLRVIIDEVEKVKKKDDFAPLEVDTKDLSAGNHTLQVMVTFRSGLVVKQTVDFEVF